MCCLDYELGLGRNEAAIIAQLLNRPGVPLPAAIALAPEPGDDEALMWLAFWELSTCRAYRHAPIAWTSIRLWATAAGLGEADTGDLGAIVRAMDARYLEHWAKAQADADKAGRSGNKR